MKNILIPTDFSIRSLRLIGKAVNKYQGEQLHITLVHALQSDNTISALLNISRRAQAAGLCTPEFLEACEIIKNKHQSAIRTIKIEFYQGSTRFYLNNFLDARNIDAIMLAADYQHESPSAQSYDMSPLLQRSKCLVHVENIVTGTQRVVREEPSISELLLA